VERRFPLIIMLNGAFGVGKSTVAKALVDRLIPNAHLFDPELVGNMVRRVAQGIRTGEEDSDDFQDIALWRSLTVQTAAALLAHYHCTLVVPMTLANPTYFREIKSGFERIDPDVRHFCLMASERTIHRRLLFRGHLPGSWPWKRTTCCLASLRSPEFAEHLDTEYLTPMQITDKIIEEL
jgi:hypothetical protein